MQVIFGWMLDIGSKDLLDASLLHLHHTPTPMTTITVTGDNHRCKIFHMLDRDTFGLVFLSDDGICF